MDTDQLLDLFNVSATTSDSALPGDSANGNASTSTSAGNVGISEEDAVDATGDVRVKGHRNVLDEMTALWDERQYEEEFDLDSFLASMKN